MSNFTGQVGTINARPTYLWPAAPSTAGGGGGSSFSGSASFSGSGALSASATPGPAITVALSGVGVLTAIAGGRALFTGTGSLSSSGAPKPVVTIALSGNGVVLETQTGMSQSLTVSFSGSGTASPSASTGTNTRTNLCTNPSFAGGSLTGWIGNGATLAADTLYAHTGTHSMKVTGQGTTAAPYMGYLPVSGSLAYTLSAYLNIPAGLSVSMFPVGINWFTSALGAVGATALATLIPAGTTTVGWQRYSVTATAPSTAAFALIFMAPSTPISSDSFWVDDWLFEQSGTLKNFFDGGTAPDERLIRSWTGVASASTSIEFAPTYKTVGGAPFSRVNGSVLYLPHRNGITQMAYAP